MSDVSVRPTGDAFEHRSLMHTIRSFIAVPLSPEVARAARRLLRDLQQEKDGIKWVPADNLHLTLKFLGDVVDREVPDVCAAIRRSVAATEPFEVTFSGTGGFPSSGRPRVIWAGLQQGEPLVDLVSSLERELAELGFKPEARDYRPHLTLGRVRSGGRRPPEELLERLAANSDRFLGKMQIDEVRLFASYLDKHGPTYHVMDTVPLGEPPAAEDEPDEI